jgi:hypothetical protein
MMFSRHREYNGGAVDRLTAILSFRPKFVRDFSGSVIHE